MHIEKGKIKKYGPYAPVPISQYESEFSQLLSLYKKHMKQDSRAMEIGTHYGGTLYHFLKEAPKYSFVLSVDDYHINSHLYEWWVPKDVDFKWIKGKSQDVKTTKEIKFLGPYDFIFIDGGHSLNDVKQDWLTAFNNINPGGIIAFHDILPHPNSEVYILWNDIAKHLSTEAYIDNPDQDGCGIGVVFC